jgi:hypothetical protein
MVCRLRRSLYGLKQAPVPGLSVLPTQMLRGLVIHLIAVHFLLIVFFLVVLSLPGRLSCKPWPC